MLDKGVFITFEGPEGAGKTTVLREIGKRCERLGVDFVMTREPGGVMIAEKIRDIILDNTHGAMDSRTEALLYAAARRQHLAEIVLPAIAARKLVLCDRFIDSSLAYQGYARGLGMDEVMSINEFAIDGTMPEKTIFFDLSPEEGLQRIARASSREKNRLDQESIQFHEDVYEGYQQLIDRYPDRIVTVDASKSVEEVSEIVWNIISSQFIFNKSS